MALGRRTVKLCRGRILKMSILTQTDEVDLLIRLRLTDLDSRNALHAALKRGLDVAVGCEVLDEPVYEGESRRESILLTRD